MKGSGLGATITQSRRDAAGVSRRMPLARTNNSSRAKNPSEERQSRERSGL